MFCRINNFMASSYHHDSQQVNWVTPVTLRNIIISHISSYAESKSLQPSDRRQFWESLRSEDDHWLPPTHPGISPNDDPTASFRLPDLQYRAGQDENFARNNSGIQLDYVLSIIVSPTNHCKYKILKYQHDVFLREILVKGNVNTGHK